jgi:hypothetical protein
MKKPSSTTTLSRVQLLSGPADEIDYRSAVFGRRNSVARVIVRPKITGRDRVQARRHDHPRQRELPAGTWLHARRNRLARIERLTEGDYLELQARGTRPGWLSWGDELEWSGPAQAPVPRERRHEAKGGEEGTSELNRQKGARNNAADSGASSQTRSWSDRSEE